MPPSDTLVRLLQRSITDEIIKAMGLAVESWQRRLVDPILWLPARRFAYLAAGLDQHLAEEGISRLAQDNLPRFASELCISGAGNIPSEGALLVATNHPGAFDGVAIIAALNRDDLKVVISDVPFTRSLPALGERMIYAASKDLRVQAQAARETIRHLDQGGAVLIMATGVVDPDPSFLPGAEAALADWSPSLELFLRKVPQTQLLITIVSGVLLPRFWNHPFVRRKTNFRKRQKLAEYIQTIYQFVSRKNLGLNARISFAPPVTLAGLQNSECVRDGVMEAIRARAKNQLTTHLQEFPPISTKS